jgi:hypothetical protein
MYEHDRSSVIAFGGITVTIFQQKLNLKLCGFALVLYKVGEHIHLLDQALKWYLSRLWRIETEILPFLMTLGAKCSIKVVVT